MLDTAPRPIAVRGGPGIGKTALTAAAFKDPGVARRFGGRRWFVSCEGIQTAVHARNQIAVTVGVTLSAHAWTSVEKLLEAGPALLILDNFEDTWHADTRESEKLLAEIATFPEVVLVVSTRGAERPIGVSWNDFPELQSLDGNAARETFLAVAGRSAFERDSSLHQVLEVLDGVPLALVLMGFAAQTHTSLDRLLSAWNRQRTELLQRGASKASNLDVSVGLSLQSERLTHGANEVAYALGTLPAGIAVVDLDHLWPEVGSEAVSALAAVGLARRFEERIVTWAPIRESMRAQVEVNEALRDRLANHYLELCAEGKALGSATGGKALVRLNPEIVNLLAVVVGASGEEPPDHLIDAVVGLGNMFRFSGVTDTGAIERALEAFRKGGRVSEEATSLKVLGDIALAHSRYAAAHDRYVAALRLFEKAGDVSGVARCGQRLGDISLEQEDWDAAERQYNDALSLFDEVEDAMGVADCTQRLGDVAQGRKSLVRARGCYEKALPMYRQLDGVLGEANCILSLGIVLGKEGHHKSAKSRYEEALPLFEKVGSTLGQANCLQHLGDAAHEQLEKELARRHYDEALRLYERIPEPFSVGQVLRRIARVLPAGQGRDSALEGARTAWKSIKREDLVEELREEFPETHSE